MRRAWLLPLLCIVSLAAPGTAAGEPVPAPVAFVVHRDGAPIGTHRLSFARDGDRLIVDIDIRLEVKLAFVTLFRYAHTARETWANGRLVAFESRTDDDGATFEVRARAVPGGLQVDGSGGAYLAPADTLPSSYWNAEMVTRRRLLDSQSGRLIDLIATPVGVRTQKIAGRDVPLRLYRLSGEITGEVGYGPDDNWVLLSFAARGSSIAYQRDARAAAGR